ncbi:adenylate and guanylate cyclase catalytic domain-containing protein [Ditylenchus destructor]|nr:adenylate and guanylate cyclase catalytic domain-containing protein [Ditylenchus destructor]
MTGTVIMGSDGVRDSTYTLSMYNEKNELVPLVQFGMVGNEVNITPLYSNAATSIWASRGGIQPLAIPVCGFDGKGCQISAFEAYKALFIVLICIVLTIITIIISGIGYIIHVRARETEAQNRLWRVSYVNLVKFQHKNRGEQSVRSLQSGPSTTSTKFTIDSVKHSKNFTVYTLFDQKVIGHKHSSLHPLEKEQMAELRGMRALDHENVNRFIGLCVDGREVLSIWRYCSRGSLRDVIKNQTLTVDAFFMFSLVRDVAEGLAHIHNSFLGFHGHLKSSYCLIDERWQVKISYYGLKTLIRRDENPRPRELLWTAPELLRENNYVGSKAGDVFSFAVICSEVINQKMAWELNENVGNNEEIVYLLKKGTSQLHPLRPVIQPAVQDVNPGIVHLLRDCWAENPNDRPKMEMVKQLLKSMNSGRNSNLMDHVFNMLEQYANTLESEVEERTKELVEEKKKSDILLYRMLPKQVAEKLKLGQSVEPETFECVTVFFSDVVSFTTLANRCTPLQVVNLLNTLYSQLDNIIAEHDVYKVETIGDGYLCVSGLPHRNANEHARHIANMSLGFIKSLDDVIIPHMPNEQIRLRIGLHTGPCVAGVVGLSMPRYCLFGDTINTASRMESSSKPNQIHISGTTNHFLTNIIGGYVTESRGELIIKGKGVMETFFLISKVENAQEHTPMYGHFKESHAGDNVH